MRKHVKIEYGDQLTVRYNGLEFHVPRQEEIPLINLVADYNEMVDELEEAKTKYADEIIHIIDGVDDDSVSSMQNALNDIRDIIEEED